MKVKSKTAGIKRYAALMLATIMVLTCAYGNVAAAKESGTQANNVVRVGYFGFEGYHNEDADGNRSGYGYEYLQQMARYTGWTYDYVGYDKSWGDAQKMLESGEIDLLTSAQKTPEREEKFDFSEQPIGYSSVLFTIKAGNEKYTIDDFSTFNGVRVGMIEGNSRNEQFDAFAKEKGFTYASVMYHDTEQMVLALQEEKIDAIVTSSLRVTQGEWVVSQFDFSPFYVCVKKGNQQLLDQVNAAIDQINQNSPGLQDELDNKYYGMDSGENVAFTEAERRYIQQWKDSGKKLKIMLNPDRAPLSYYDNGQMKGIFVETVEHIMELSQIPYEIVVVKTREEYDKYRDEHLVDICADMRFDYNMAEKAGYRITDSYYTADVSRVIRSDFDGTIKTIAAIRNSDMESNLRQQFFNTAAIQYYDTGDECVEAVKNGSAEAAYLYTYVAEKYLEKDVTNRLTTSLIPDLTTDFCIGIGDTEDTTLYSIISKSVSGLTTYWVDQVTLRYTQKDADNLSFVGLFYDYPVAFMIALLVLLCLIGIIITLFYRQNMRTKDEERAKEIQRLFAYVCREHENVMEVNLQTMMAQDYSLKDGVLQIQQHPYRTENNYNDFLRPEDYDNVTQQFHEADLLQLIQNGKGYEFEAQGKAADGTYQWYIYTIYGIIPDKLHPKNFMLFKRNIDDLRRKEEESKKALMDALEMAKEASKAKGNFMSRMSHEIRTPLNAVIGYMDIAKNSVDNPEKMMHCVENSDMAARHLLSIINDVLDISSIESGRMKIAHEEFDLENQISSVSAIFYQQAKQKKVNFEVVLEKFNQQWVIGDSLRLNQILMNLLSNAVKFTPEGGNVTLTVSQMQMDDKKVHMKFTVRDTGIGMSEEYQKRLFTPFEQESASTARKYGGTGLGLSISYNLIQMMGGSIEVESKQNEGTSFVVSLEFQRSKRTADEQQTIQDYSHVNVLIVDDDKDSCAYMKSLLERCGVASDTVTSGKAAVRQVRRKMSTDDKYDMIIMDWNMPEMDGIETAKRIRMQVETNIPIIIATAYDVTNFEDEAKDAGVDKVIAKPIFQSTMFDLLVSTYGKYETNTLEEQHYENIKGMRVLLAEDSPMNMEIAMDILGRGGLEVDSVTDGKQAVDRFLAQPAGSYDVILMDIQMPVLNGYEATVQIRKSAHPQAKTIPIIAMTANAFSEDVNAALASGMNGHIAKPVDYDKLYKILQQYGKDEV